MYSPHSVKVLESVTPKASGVVIFLHGLGDTNAGWAMHMRMLQQHRLPHIKFVLPTASEMPISRFFGQSTTAWHDINSNVGEEQEFNGIDESMQRIHGLIQKEISNGFKASQIILGGFSQGAGLSLYAGYQYPERLAAVVALSGYLPFQKKFGNLLNPSNSSTPAFVAHGTADDIVEHKYGESAYKALEGLGVPVSFKSYRGMAHSSSDEEMEDMVRFVLSHIPHHG